MKVAMETVSFTERQFDMKYNAFCMMRDWSNAALSMWHSPPTLQEETQLAHSIQSPCPHLTAHWIWGKEPSWPLVTLVYGTAPMCPQGTWPRSDVLDICLLGWWEVPASRRDGHLPAAVAIQCLFHWIDKKAKVQQSCLCPSPSPS